MKPDAHLKQKNLGLARQNAELKTRNRVLSETIASFKFLTLDQSQQIKSLESSINKISTSTLILADKLVIRPKLDKETSFIVDLDEVVEENLIEDQVVRQDVLMDYEVDVPVCEVPVGRPKRGIQEVDYSLPKLNSKLRQGSKWSFT